MPRKKSRQLVIDADVACAAGGEDAVHPTSKSCREFLRSVLEVCHRLVVTDSLVAEWNSHQSNFARTWRAQMVARKKVVLYKQRSRRRLRSRVERTAATVSDVDILRKDFHLLESAMDRDNTIVSMDETVRSLLKTACASVAEIRDVIWVNPSCDGESVIEWLERGARPERQRRLFQR